MEASRTIRKGDLLDIDKIKVCIDEAFAIDPDV